MQGRLISISLFVAGFAALSFLVVGFSQAEAQGGELKNLKVYPKTTTKKAIKKEMKSITKALGVQCDHCHEPKDFSKDIPMKEEARRMMRMQKRINAKDLKRYGAKVSCATCHRGKAKPTR